MGGENDGHARWRGALWDHGLMLTPSPDGRKGPAGPASERGGRAD